MKTVQTVYGVFDTDLGRLVGIAPQGVSDVTFLAGQDTQTDGIPVTALVNPVTGVIEIIDPETGLPLDLSGVGGGAAIAPVSGSATSLLGSAAGNHLLVKSTATNSGTRVYIEPNGNPTGLAAKMDFMFDPYESDSVNYRILNLNTFRYDPANASTTQGNNGIAVIGAKAVGTQWGVWPSIHFGFSDDGAGAAVPMKMYYFDTSDTVWRAPMVGGWRAGMAVNAGDYVTASSKIYLSATTAMTGASKPSHAAGDVSDGVVTWSFVRDVAAASAAIKGNVVFGDRDDLPKFGFANVVAQFAKDILMWSTKRVNFANESGGVSASIYATTGLGSDEIRIEVASNKAIRLNATNKFFALVGLRRVVGSATITSNTATPSVLDTEHLLLTNTAATNVTSFTDMLPNQIFSVEAGNANTTLVHGSNLKLSGGANKALTVDAVLMFKVSASGTIAKQILG